MKIKYKVACHTDNVTYGTTFVVIDGAKENGITYIPKAIELGAKKIVLQEDQQLNNNIINLAKEKNVEIVYCKDARLELAKLSAQTYDYPAKKLKIIGITGTKGKTTTTFLVHHILQHAGYKTALLSTVRNSINNHIFKTDLTTKQPDYLHAFFDLCAKENIEYVVMEVAAQALSLSRVYGIEFDSIIFTNFAKEHAEFYSTQDTYFEAKKLLFAQAKESAPKFINHDDPKLFDLKSLYKNIKTFGIKNPSDYNANILKNDLSGIKFELKSEHISQIIETPALVGEFNVYNIMAAAIVALNFGINITQIKDAILNFDKVPGRMDKHKLKNGAISFIDYAHNPSSFEAILQTVRPFCKNLIVVFGAGGDRDKTKRPLMGSCAAQIADTVILTTDNPRSENPENIIEDILFGIPDIHRSKVICELDREKAIKIAYEHSDAQSTILLLGKGPDEYQIIKGVYYPFSEAEILKAL